jgi:glycosyltransferase 2 family protein
MWALTGRYEMMSKKQLCPQLESEKVRLMGVPSSMRRLAFFFVKAAITALFLYLSLGRVNLDSFKSRLGDLEIGWIALVLLTVCVQLPLLALRWRDIVAVCGGRLQVATALRYTSIGFFFSQVLPSTVGGDAARIWLLARGGAGWQAATYSVLIDRVVGLAALAVLVVACLPWTLTFIPDHVARVGLVLIGFGTVASVIAFLLLGAQPLQVLQKWWLTRHLAASSRLAWRLCRSTVEGTRVAFLSFGNHLITAMAAWSAFMAVHATVDFMQVFILVMPVILIAAIPVSIAGWGLRESAMVLAFSHAGPAASDALIVSILLGAANFAIGLFGGIVWVASGYRGIERIKLNTLTHEPSA